MIKVASCNRCFKQFEYAATAGRSRQSCDKCRNKDRIGAATVKCAYCEELFAPQRRRPNEHCSIECRNDAWKAKRAAVALACRRCGEPLSRKPCEVTVAKYCTTQCRDMARHERVSTIGPEPPPVAGARWIRLTKGYFALVDADLFDGLSAHPWVAVETPRDRAVYAY